MSDRDLYTVMKAKNQSLVVGQFTSIVQVWHKDNSFFYLPFAYTEEDTTFLYIYTQHCGFLYFHKDDLSDWRIKMADGTYKIKTS